MGSEDWLPKEQWSQVSLPFTKLATSFVSGVQDRNRIQIDYYHNQAAPEILHAKIVYGEYSAGPPGHAHGGAQAAVLDELCGGIVWLENHQALAVKLETEFLQIVPLHEILYGWSRVIHAEKRKVYTEAFIENSSGTVLAKATVLFVKLTPSQLAHLSITS